MRVRSLVLPVLVAAIAAAILISRVGGPSGVTSSRPSPSGESGSGRRELGEAARAAPANAADPVPTRTNSADARVGGKDGGASGDPDVQPIVSIEAMVSVVDPDGREHLDESGIAKLHWDQEGQEQEELELPVKEGRFEVKAPRETAYYLHVLILEGHPVDFDPVNFWRSSESSTSRVTVHARRARPFRIRVIDASTGFDLHGISVVRKLDDVRFEAMRAGSIPDEAVLRRDASSPIDLEATVHGMKPVDWWPDLLVTADGYSSSELWNTVDFRKGGEVVVPLTRCGALDVKVSGAPPDASLMVCRPPRPLSEEDRQFFEENGIRDQGESFATIQLEGEQAVRLDKIPSGALVVSVEVGPPPQTIALAEAAIDLPPGETKKVALQCKPYRTPQRVAVSGTIEIKGSWKDEPFTLELRAKRRAGLPFDMISADLKRSDMEPVSDEPRILRWKANGLVPATCVASILEFSFREEFDVGPSGRADVELQVGECGDLVCRFVDARGRDVEPLSFVRWIVGSAGDPYCGLFFVEDSIVTMPSEDRPILRRLRVPIGQGTPYMYDTEWTLVDCSPVEVHPGTNEFTFHVRHACGIELLLTCEGTRIAWPNSGDCDVEAIDGDGEARRSADEILVTLPGRYRVTLPEIPGFETVPPFEVDIAEGPYAERVVELHRKH